MGAVLAAQFIASVLQISLSARMLGPEGYGVLAILIAITGVTFGLISVPGHDAITAYVTRSVAMGRVDEAASTMRFILIVALMLGLVSYVVVAVIALGAGSLAGVDPAHARALLLYGLSGIFMATYRESLAILRSADRVSLGAAVSVFSGLARIAVLVAGWLAGGGLLAVVAAYVVGAAVNGCGMFVAGALNAKRAGVDGFMGSFSVSVPRDVLRFQFASFGRSSLQTLAAQMDVVLIAPLTSTVQLGLYRATRNLIEATRWPFLQVEAGVQVEYSRQWYNSDGSALRGLARRFTMLSMVCAAVGYMLLLVVHEPLIHALFGQEFIGGVRPLLFLIPGAFAFACVAAVHVLPMATGRGLPPLISLAVSVSVQAVVILLWVPEFGASGGAWSYTAGHVAYAVVIVPFVLQVVRQSRNLATSGSSHSTTR